MATTYKVKEIKEDAGSICVTVTVTIDGQSEDGMLYLSSDEMAAVLADPTQYVGICEKLAALTEVRLMKMLQGKIDPDTVTIDPVKVQEEKSKL